MVCKLIEDEESGDVQSLVGFLEDCLRHKSEMVVYESAHAIVNLRRTGARELASAVSVLQLFCSSAKPALRFAAVRTLNKVAMTHPAAVTACNLDLENLITDSNRSIATLAITTLLKTGGEASVDRLMKQIASFVSEISDEFKVVVVEAIRSLGLKFPRKHGVLKAHAPSSRPSTFVLSTTESFWKMQLFEPLLCQLLLILAPLAKTFYPTFWFFFSAVRWTRMMKFAIVPRISIQYCHVNRMLSTASTSWKVYR